MSGLLVTASAAPSADPEGTITRRDMLGGYLLEYQKVEVEIMLLEEWLRKSMRRIEEGREWLFANRNHPQYNAHYKTWCAWGARDFERTSEMADLIAKNANRSNRAAQVWDRMSEEERAEWFPDAVDLPGWSIWTRLRDEAAKDGKPGDDVSF